MYDLRLGHHAEEARALQKAGVIKNLHFVCLLQEVCAYLQYICTTRQPTCMNRGGKDMQQTSIGKEGDPVRDIYIQWWVTDRQTKREATLQMKRTGKRDA